LDSELVKKLEDAIWIAKSLFDRGKTSGSSANMSFRHGNNIYITGSNTCFGNLEPTSFSLVDLEGNHIDGIKPSKEFPLHREFYKKSDNIQAVIHIHSFYSTLWSCLPHDNEKDCIPTYTPYLGMKLGPVGLVPYAKPGSKDLFKAFAEHIGEADGYLLSNHGPIVGGKDLFEAFYRIEELEESARLAWELREEKAKLIK
jgi:ribulose-5-phosphate 4-epimerase/fuculose-1-phosphate aldolase